MRNFSEQQIVGGSVLPPIPGSKFDNFNDLIDKYYALLFFTLKDGITYSTDRRGILAKVIVQDNGFVNYVQPSIGKWDYTDEKYQRLVSPEFVLYLFNNLCMSESLYRINELAEPIQLSSNQQLYPNGIDLDEFNVSKIISLYEQYAEEYFKYQNGQPNNYSEIPRSKIDFVNLAYSLIEKVTKFAKDYVDHQMMVIKATELKQDLENGVISYEDLTEEQQNLVDDEYYDEVCDMDSYNMNYYLSLGFLNNSIRNHAIEEIYKRQNKVSNLVETKENSLALKQIYDDPISVELDYDDENEYTANIDYKGAKEFELGNNIKLERK